MATITLRTVTGSSTGATTKGSPLSNEEVDNNFDNLNLFKAETSNAVSTANVNTTVYRDVNGNFAANIITANSISITGTETGSVTTTDLTVTGNAIFLSNAFIQVPQGTTSQRGDLEEFGLLRYNTEEETFEGYGAEGWGPIGGALEYDANVYINSIGVGTVQSNVTGEIRATNQITAYYSDDRLKIFEGNIPNAVDKVMAINGYYFKENQTAKDLGYNNEERQVGVSAQEILSVLPEVVKPAPISDKYYTVQYEKIIPLLIEAIKEQQRMIDELKNNSHNH